VYNQDYLATIKMNNKYIVKNERENNDNINTSMNDNSVRLTGFIGYLVYIAEHK